MPSTFTIPNLNFSCICPTVKGISNSFVSVKIKALDVLIDKNSLLKSLYQLSQNFSVANKVVFQI